MTTPIKSQDITIHHTIRKTNWNTIWLYIVLVFRFCMGSIWFYSGYIKYTENYIDLLTSIRAYDLFSDASITFIANVLPVAEMMLGILIVFGIFIKPLGYISNFVLTLFIIGIFQAIMRGMNIDCGCFGAGDPRSGTSLDMWLTILRDICFIIITLTFTLTKNQKLLFFPKYKKVKNNFQKT